MSPTLRKHLALALAVSGVRARVVAPDGRHSVATSGTADLNTGRPVSRGPPATPPSRRSKTASAHCSWAARYRRGIRPR
ncbi:hypothetical protein [Streptomyces sp. 6N106]|uniref:hypothetical protein n=1 Tax=Streptomyces sp. 6N106 TaxID=3457418 RepID=UPI003FD25F0B